MNMELWIVTTLVYLINIPFGYWRANVKAKSLQWILAIHIPVPFVILLRIYSDIGFAFYTYPVIVGAYFLGQFTGVKLSQGRKQSGCFTTSCLVMDYYRSIKSN